MLVSLFAILLLTGCQAQTELFIIGYCPTMEETASAIAQHNEVNIIPQASTAQALDNLERGLIDVALVGRPARHDEARGANEKRLVDGYTLVGSLAVIQRSDLSNITVHTAANPNVTNELLPTTRIVNHNTTREALSAGETTLIHWSEWTDEPIITVLEGEKKDKEFRAPILYAYQQELLSTINYRNEMKE